MWSNIKNNHISFKIVWEIHLDFLIQRHCVSYFVAEWLASAALGLSVGLRFCQGRHKLYAVL